MAGASDLYEIESSQLALSRAQRPEVRQFAQMLIQDHTNSTQQVVAAATAAGYAPPPPQLMPMHADMLRQLQNASGGAFERLYLTQQIPAHENALRLHQNYAANGDTPALRTVAAAIVPVVQGHLSRVRQLRGQ
jgi:putative membrane protein